ncbi:MAG: hypothetical protein P8012_00010 [Desulfobacterales bacterium]
MTQATSETTEIVKTQPLPPELRAQMLNDQRSLFLNVAKFEQMQRAAQMLARATFIPDEFRNNIGNVMIALNLAERMNTDPVILMQVMYVVKGRPGFEGKFLSALVNNSGRYEGKLKYEWKGEPGKPEWGCRAYAILRGTDERVNGPWCDWKMVVAEGWNKPKGGNKPGSTPQKSKWETMPELMFMYRAASFFCNTHDSDLKMGMATVEELEDIHHDADLFKQPDGTFAAGNDPGDKTAADIYGKTQEPPKNDATEQDAPAPGEGDSDLGENESEEGLEKVEEETKKEPSPEAPKWNPLEEPVKQRYFPDKKEILERVAKERGLQVDELAAKNDYQTIHQMILSSASGVPMDEILDDGKGEEQPPQEDDAPPEEGPPMEPSQESDGGIRSLCFRYKKQWPDLWKMGAKNKGIDPKAMISDISIQNCKVLAREVESLIDLRNSQEGMNNDSIDGKF